jgi:hypothetical protein
VNQTAQQHDDTFEKLAIAALFVLIGLVAVVWAGAQLATLVAHGHPLHTTFEEAGKAMFAMKDHMGDPARHGCPSNWSSCRARSCTGSRRSWPWWPASAWRTSRGRCSATRPSHSSSGGGQRCPPRAGGQAGGAAPAADPAAAAGTVRPRASGPAPDRHRGCRVHQTPAPVLKRARRGHAGGPEPAGDVSAEIAGAETSAPGSSIRDNLEMSDGGRQLISVVFTAPVEGVDPVRGDVVVSKRHRVAALYVRQDRTETLFVNDEGEVVARWATRLIERIEWPPEGTEAPALKPRVGTLQWREEIQTRHRNAYQAWTAEEEAVLAGEFHNGLTVAQMADRHERRPGGITARLVRLGLAPHDNSDPADGLVAAADGPGPQDSDPEAVVEVTDDVCRHELALGTCSICKKDGRPAVYTTSGGSHYHRRPDCPALLDGQRRIESAGGVTAAIEMLHRGSARLEGRDPCLRCAPD